MATNEFRVCYLLIKQPNRPWELEISIVAVFSNPP